MDAVTIEVPYFYQAEFVPPRARNPVRRVLGGTTQVEIQSVSDDEAPRVVTWKDRVHGDDLQMTIRAWEGAFYAPSRSRGEAITADAIKPSVIHDYRDFRHELSRWESEGLPKRPEGRMRSVGGEFLGPEQEELVAEMAANAVQRSADQLVIIDGVLHERRQLPQVVASIQYHMRGPNSIRIIVNEMRSQQRENGEENEDRLGARGMRFEIGDHALAMAWAEDRVAQEAKTRGGAEIHTDLEVEVHAPDLLPASDLLAREVVRVCRFVVMDHDLKLKERDDPLIEAWMITRRSLLRAERAISLGDADARDFEIDALVRATVGFFEAYEKDEDRRCRSFGSSYDPDSDIHRHAFVCAASVWEMRPVRDLEVSLPMP